MNLVITDSVQFMNSSFGKLVKNLGDSDFKYLTQFVSRNLELLKQKDAQLIHISTWTVLKGFLKKKKKKKKN